VDRNAERTLIPYHVKLSIEGLPQHAWFQELADKILGDVAIINHVDQATRRREDQRFFVCWAFCHNPSQIPQLVYLTLTDRHADPRLDAHIQFSRPRTLKQGHTFRVLRHIDSIEDLSFYHHPAEQLLADGRVQFREFHWRPGHPDGAMEEVPRPPSFRFEAHWPLMPNFKECVEQSWVAEVNSSHNAFLALHIKLARTAKALASWARSLIPPAVICLEVIAQLDKA
jgi:hypothetical protein